jgi:hypothetical protein
MVVDVMNITYGSLAFATDAGGRQRKKADLADGASTAAPCSCSPGTARNFTANFTAMSAEWAPNHALDST